MTARNISSKLRHIGLMVRKREKREIKLVTTAFTLTSKGSSCCIKFSKVIGQISVLIFNALMLYSFTSNHLQDA